MSSSSDVTTGVTLVAGTSAWSFDLTGINHTGVSRGSVASSHMGTAAAGAGKYGNMTFLPGDLSDPGSLEVEGFYNPDTEPPIDQPAETWTVTYAASGGDSTGGIHAASGFLTDFNTTGPLDDAMTFSATIKLSGNVTQTAGA
jgi:hypothetical protein